MRLQRPIEQWFWTWALRPTSGPKQIWNGPGAFCVKCIFLCISYGTYIFYVFPMWHIFSMYFLCDIYFLCISYETYFFYVFLMWHVFSMYSLCEMYCLCISYGKCIFYVFPVWLLFYKSHSNLPSLSFKLWRQTFRHSKASARLNTFVPNGHIQTKSQIDAISRQKAKLMRNQRMLATKAAQSTGNR